jgi:hypothetical protein
MGLRADIGEMSTSNQIMGQPHQPRRLRPRAASGWRGLVVIGLVCHLLYTPIHLVLESHSDDVSPIRTASAPTTQACLDYNDSHQDAHHEWHPSFQHNCEAINCSPLVVRSTLTVVVMPWREAVEGISQLQEPPDGRWHGLAPPGLVRTWQFHTRAAPPVRAPAVLS